VSFQVNAVPEESDDRMGSTKGCYYWPVIVLIYLVVIQQGNPAQAKSRSMAKPPQLHIRIGLVVDSVD
jgi:hypothetical protein